MAQSCHTPRMATYIISASGSSGYRAVAAEDGGMLHVCGGLATEADAQMWVAAHKRATQSEHRAEHRSASGRAEPAEG